MGGKVENGSGVENISRLDQSKEERLLSQHRKKKDNKGETVSDRSRIK